jgi:hypothetical protein
MGIKEEEEEGEDVGCGLSRPTVRAIGRIGVGC